jgi:hypothetical protein
MEFAKLKFGVSSANLILCAFAASFAPFARNLFSTQTRKGRPKGAKKQIRTLRLGEKAWLYEEENG